VSYATWRHNRHAHHDEKAVHSSWVPVLAWYLLLLLIPALCPLASRCGLTMSSAWLAPSCASFFCSAKLSKMSLTTGQLLLPCRGLPAASARAHAYAASASHAASRTRLSVSCKQAAPFSSYSQLRVLQ
jgi:hypothetical protein